MPVRVYRWNFASTPRMKSARCIPGRWEKFSGSYRQTPWEGRFHSYGRKAGMLVPSGGEVGWYDAGSWQKVWTGSILESSYELMQ
jgi:hypothetical protein